MEKLKNGLSTDDRMKLEVPSEQAQQHRKEVIIERMLKDSKPPKTFRLEASSLLNKIKDFLPEMQQANDKLKSMSKDEMEQVVVENVPEGSESYIEMNLCMYSDSEVESDTEESEILGYLLDSNSELKTSRHTTPLVEVVPKDDPS